MTKQKSPTEVNSSVDKPVIRTPYNPPIYKGQHISQPSLTVPNQAMSVQEIMNRYAKGLPVYGQKIELWEGDEEFMPDLKGLDLSEIQTLREEAAERIDEIRKKYSMEFEKAERNKLLKQLKAEIDQANAEAEGKKEPEKPKKGPRPGNDEAVRS